MPSKNLTWYSWFSWTSPISHSNLTLLWTIFLLTIHSSFLYKPMKPSLISWSNVICFPSSSITIADTSIVVETVELGIAYIFFVFILTGNFWCSNFFCQ